MAKRTALYGWHRDAGARFIEFGGWDMPLRYAGIVEEHLAVRSAVGLFDVSHMGKLFVEGGGAHALLDGLSANAIPSRAGRARYTHLLRDDGTILDDVIVSCLAPGRFLVVCNAGPRPSVVAWFEAHRFGDVRIEDLTDEFLCIAVQGPRAFELLGRVTSADLASLRAFDAAMADLRPASEASGSGTAVPPETKGWGSPGAGLRDAGGTTVSTGGVPVLVTRTGYTGEPGVELFPPVAMGRWVWESLLAEGADLGVRPIGLGARDTLRLEKGYLLSGQDFDGRQTPLEMNSEWLVKWDRAFLGRAALIAQRGRGDHNRLVGVRMEDRGIPRHGQEVHADGAQVGTVTSGSLSPSMRIGIALASVRPDYAAEGTSLRVEVRAVTHPARVVSLPFL